ncbi:phytase [Promicromonospora aerolata]|uniref:Phytase n=1 Tax=Promicromonospora aerolata TaxID=195749 RepID=A0ABW4V9J4_9MICO
MRRRLAAPPAALLLLSTLVPASAAASGGPDHPAPAPATVTTSVETPALYDDEAGGNASGDDPAIWVHPEHSDRSLVVATAKEGGLRVYSVAATELQSVAATAAPRADGVPGRYNNVDIAYGLDVDGRPTDVAVVSDRYNDQIRFFAIDPAGAGATTPLTEVTAPELEFLFSPDRATVAAEQTAYGLAVYRAQGETYAVVTQEGSTTIATARLTTGPDGIGYTDVQHLAMPGEFPLPDGTTWVPCEEPGVGPQLEGVSVDHRTGTLYAAQEDVGLWRVPLPLGSGEPRLIDKVTDFGVHDAYDPETDECAPVDPEAPSYGGKNLTADAEGVDIWYGPGRTGYVLVSSQGDDTYGVYALTGRNRSLGSFRVAGDGVDDVNGSDGIAVSNAPVGEYGSGLLVTHDEPETGPDADGERDATGFSYVHWSDVTQALRLR